MNINDILNEQSCDFDDEISDPSFQINEEASDCESEATIEHWDEDTSDDDDETPPNQETTSDGYYVGRNGIKWNKAPPPTSRVRSHNIFTARSRGIGPIMTSHDPLSIFKIIFTEEMSDIIIRETNRKAKQTIEAWNEANPTRPKEWHPLTPKEFDAFLAMLIASGLYKSNNEPAYCLFDTNHPPIFRAVMSFKRFKLLLRYIRFDNVNTRMERSQSSKTAAIDDIWLMLQANLASQYEPHDALTVDEQLFPYRGRTSFTQYIPSKPAKYGIKVWWICDANTKYPLKGIIYSGKAPGQERETQLGYKVTMRLAQKYLFTGRIVYADNFFSSLELAENLITQRTAFVGTLRANKACIPSEFRKNRNRPIDSTLFGYHDNNVALCSYVPKKNKAVVLISTAHYTNAVEGAHQKPMAIVDYNKNKAGVDTMDQMLGTYTCKRGTKRWPLAMFYNIVDVAALASFIAYNDLNPSQKSDRRRSFLYKLVQQLATPEIEERALNNRITRYPHIKRAMMDYNVIPLEESITSEAPPIQHRDQRKTCYLCQQYNNRQRKTRFACCDCRKFVCMEHSEQMHRCMACKTSRIQRAEQ